MDHRYRNLPFALAPALLALASPGHAQSASDFRLQPGAQPRAPGPVDADNPAAPAPARTTPAAQPGAAAPAPSPTPTLVIPPPPKTAPAPAQSTAGAASRPAAESASPRVVPATARPAQPSPALAVNAEPSLAPPTALPPVLPPIASPAPTATPSTAAAAPASGLVAWWWLLPAALLGALGAWAALARRKEPESPEFVRPRAQAAPSARPANLPPPAAERAAPPAPTPAAPPTPAAADPLELALEPVRFSVSLVNATLNYRLVLTNRSAGMLGPLHVAADMIAAHSSMPADVQLGLDGAGLELRHEVADLAAGETVALTGDLRLPLAAITPILSGGAALLVPLVRLRVDGAGPTRTTALVVGEPPVSPGGPLRPFRLDQGPRIIGAVSQRPLATAA